jgi:ATP-dependent Clp endopeptidase proteolytic subunit ClpP
MTSGCREHNLGRRTRYSEADGASGNLAARGLSQAYRVLRLRPHGYDALAQPADGTIHELRIKTKGSRWRPDIQTTCVGIAVAMGAVLLAGGTEGKRTALPNAKILLHQVSGGFEGRATDIEIQAREVINVKRRLEEIIAEHTGQPLERVSKDMERDYFLTPEEAREYGIIDRVIAHR